MASSPAGLSVAYAYRAAMLLVRAALRLSAALALCAGLQMLSAHAAVHQPGPLPEPFDATAIDRGANACSDFFAFATGAYRKAHPIPAAYSEYGYIEELVDRTRDTLRDILERAQRDPGGAGSPAAKLGAFYGACMDTAAIERRGLAPAAPELARIAAIARVDQIAAELAHLHSIGVDAGFAFDPTQDSLDSSRTIGEIDQAGLGLPERDYYLRRDVDSRKLRTQYTNYIETLLRLSADPAAAAHAVAILTFETRLATASTPLADLRQPEMTYHPMPIAAVVALAPHLALRSYLHANAIASRAPLNVAEPRFVRTLDRALVDTPLETWKSYLRWRFLDTYAPALPARFELAQFAFRGQIIDGAKEQLPRWKRCVTATDLQLGEALGEAYVARDFSPASKADALALTVRVKQAYHDELAGLTWMTAATKRIALAKLAAMGLNVGYPAKWRSYAAYSVAPGAYFTDVERGLTFNRNYDLARIGRPVNRTTWFMTPQTVDAYNDIQRNEIVLPAAQLQRPFYDPAVDDAANIGATGAGTIGHEMTHGFDDEGHKYDARGNLRNWWTPGDLKQFDTRAQCVIDQFDRIVATGNVHYQGRLVAGEAIADFGGLVIGYHALETSLRGKARTAIDGFTPEQRYFLAYGQSWAESIRPQAARAEALGDPHPLPRDRVNATVANVPGWYAAFNCPKPVRPVCEIW